MRLKQILGMVLLPCIAITMAAAAGSQLTQVHVASQGGSTTLTLRTTGAFTHTEYRPTDNLMLLDLSGVSAARMDDKAHLLHAPNVVSYRVLSYKSSSGANVARLELTLAASSHVQVSDGSNELIINVANGASAATTPEMAPALDTTSASDASTQPMSASQAVEKTVAHEKLVNLHHVGVVRGKDGVEVEIRASGPLFPKAIQLSSPDRLVLDLPNTLPSAQAKSIAVNSSDLKAIRIARYQLNPPVTRIVLDLTAAHDYDLAQKGNILLVKLRAVSAKSAPAAPAASQQTNISEVASAKSEPTPNVATAPPADTKATNASSTPPADGKATDFAVIKPEFHPAATAAATPTAPVLAADVKAASAASKFNGTADNSYNLAPATSASMHPLSNTNLAFQQQAAPASSSMRPKYTGEPISVNLKDVDLKDFFRLIHEISGLNVVLDPSVHGTLTIVLDDVPWDQALDIVLKNNGLDRQLEGNVLRIAEVDTLKKEADARREQIEAQALAVDKVTVTRFLSYAHSKDVVPTIKKFLSARGDVVSDDRTNALIIDDIPNVIPKIDELLSKLDRKTQEVEIEARVVAATRQFARDIGTALGFGWGNGVSAVGGLGQVGQTNTQVTLPNGSAYVANPNGAGKASTIPLFSNLASTGPTSGLTFVNATQNVRLDMQLSLAESRGLLKILSRPRVVTQNNIQALIRQGVRVPIVTQAQLGGPPTVNYVDAFLRLTVTPQITVENTIFLNIDVENTTPDFSREIQGNPTLLTQQATTQVLVTDGGTVVIGGVIQTTNSLNIEQVPLLGNIPVLGYLFKHRQVSTSTQELIFFITPRIIQT
jgi:type IV pilus assembly protein PilQ